MTRSGSFPDRVRVSDADDRDFRSCAGEQREEDPHGAFLRSGLRGAGARSRGLLRMGSGARLARPGCTDSSARPLPEQAQRPKNLAQPLHAGFVRVGKASPRKPRPGTRRDRVR